MTTSAHSPFKIGYARVSTNTQDEALQLDALQRACVDRVFIDRASGSVQDRPGLTSALECARSGDTLVVWRLDRLGRSLRHLIDVVHALEQRGVALVSLTEQIDTSTPGGRLVFHVFASLAQFEKELIHERTMAGLAAARARGRVGGRPTVWTQDKLRTARSMRDSGDYDVTAIAKVLGVSAGLLRGGAIAWVEVSMPDTITTPEGVAFRPNLLATTSFDGSIATTYKRTVTDTVCDNTRELALSEVGQEVKVKHSRNSHAQLGPARQALAMVHTLADDFAQEVARLCRVEVTQSQWQAFLDVHVPRHVNDGTAMTGRSLTTADRKWDILTTLYASDPRVSPWAGTAHGVLQAVNTYEHHEGVVRGERAERNGLKTINGDFGRLDRSTWKTLNAILNRPDLVRQTT